jgi:hypothetical protein
MPTAFKLFAMQLLAKAIRATTVTSRDLPAGYDFNPRELFSANEQGIWLDPSDFSTLYQDAAGTTPVTAVGQPVGLALDKRLGLALGAELVTNGDFDNADGWVLQSEVSISSGSLNFNATETRSATATGASCVSGRWYVVEFDLTYTSGTARFNAGGGTTTITGSTGHKKYIRQATGTNAFYFSCASAGAVYSIDNVTVRELPGNHATQSTSASRPTLQQDSNGMYYLGFDGTDDGMATPSIDFTGTDKMTVWTGVRKLSDAAAGTVVELSASATGNLGGFFLRAPQSAASTYSFLSGGSAFSTAVSSLGYVAPISNILTGIGDISGDACSLRVNGTTVTSATDQGTGNYGNYPLFIGRRGGASLPFNGRIYQLIIRGAESNAGQIAAGEAWCNGKTRAY